MNDELDQMIRRYGDELGRAQRQQAPARGFAARRGRILAVGAAAGVALAVGIALAPGGSGQLDPLERAQAALGTSSDIQHYRYLSYALIGAERKKTPVSDGEFWSTEQPERSRMAFSQPDIPHAEMAYADGVETNYDAQRKTLVRTTGVTHPQGSVGDQIAQIRKQLADGELHPAGTAMVRGRQVLRLVGKKTTAEKGFDMSDPPKPSVLRQTFELQYDVDPKTYAPVRIQTTERHPPFHDNGPVVEIFDFLFYEKLPPTDENLKLLEIQPAPGTTVTEEQAPKPGYMPPMLTKKEFLKMERARKAREAAKH